MGDVNEDGLDDIAALPRKGLGPHVFLSDGVGGWTDRSDDLQYDGPISCGIGTRLVDINQDGHLDLLVADHCEGVFVFLGDGKGNWTKSSEGIPRNVGGFNDAEAGDLDGDGIKDIVALSAFTAGFMVLKGRKDGTWQVWPDTGLPSSGLGFNLRLIDANGDGLPDVITSFQPTQAERRTTPPPPAKVWINGPAGKFRAAAGFSETGRFYSMAVRPRPDRAVPDLIAALAGAYGGLYLYGSETGEEWTGRGRIDNAGFPEAGAGFIGLEAVDFDGDGCEELLTSEGSTGRVWLALGNCTDQWKFCPEETVPMDPPLPVWGVTTGDFNGDGRRDIAAAFGRGSVGAVKAWFQVSQ